MVPCITSRENAAVKYACKVRDDAAFRRAEGVFFAEGVRLCEELARAFRPYKVYYLDSKRAAAEALGGQACEVSLPVAQKLAGHAHAAGCLRCFHARRPCRSRRLPAKGAICASSACKTPPTSARCCAAQRPSALTPWPSHPAVQTRSPKRRCAPLWARRQGAGGGCAAVSGFSARAGRKGLRRVCGGAAKFAPAGRGRAARRRRACPGYWQRGGRPFAEAVAAAGMAVRIPMTGAVESLNAAVAGSILLWHFRGVGL